MIRINTEQDSRIEPGHQLLEVEDTPQGRALATLLYGHVPAFRHGDRLIIPHDATVDTNIVELINELARVRYESPVMVQLTLAAAPMQFQPKEAEELE
jgi:hypothetical protein